MERLTEVATSIISLLSAVIVSTVIELFHVPNCAVAISAISDLNFRI